MTDSTADAAKRLPCPFCGGEPQQKDGYVRHWVECSKCGVRTRRSEGTQTCHERWNSRPEPAPPEGEPDFKILAGNLTAVHPLICGPCGAVLPNPDCGHRANGVPGCCIPLSENLEETIADELKSMYRLGLAARRLQKTHD